MGKTFLATALGHIACRRRIGVHFERADKLFKRLKAARLDASYDQEMRKLIGIDLLVVDDFALAALDAIETADVYELCVERHRRAATVMTSNRDPSKAHRFARTCARWWLKGTGPSGRPIQAPGVDVIGEVVNEAFGFHAERLAGDLGVEGGDEIHDASGAQTFGRHPSRIEHVAEVCR